MQNKNAQKQAFFFTIINYVGILIGIVSTLFIYPKNKEMLGVFRYVESIAQFLFPVLLLGASQSLINFYPKLNESHKKKLFNYSVFSIFLISGISLIFLLLASNFSFLKGMKYVYFAFPIAVFLALIELFKKQSTIIQKIAIPTFFDNILPKIALPLLFVLVLQQVISTNQSLFFYVLSYGLIFLLITWYLFYHFRPQIDFDFKSLFVNISKKEYYRFSAFAFAGSLGSVFAFRIDAIMIKSFFSLESVGTFSIGVTLASAIAIPATGIFSLYAPIISDFLKNNQLLELNKKYKETAKLLFFIGAILYSCIFLGIENLFQMLPTHENLLASVPIILILGFNVLINMGTGFNGEIITYSKFYKFNLIAITLLVVLNIALNLVFILVFKLGIEAVAYASLISMVVFNFAKLWFIHRKFKLFPFDKSFLKLVIVFISVLLICNFLPNLSNIFQNLILKISVCLLLNLSIIYKLKLVYSYNFWLDKIKK
jgi:O-antigen/teichoic acid export membrane protein